MGCNSRRVEFMTHRTAKLSSFDAYVETGDESAADLVDTRSERLEILTRFPFAVMLEVAFPELDFANRWCWNNFGVGHGECFEKYSNYRSCTIDFPHCHIGTWMNLWFVKTDYDFGFNEWYFLTTADRDSFLEFVPSINWGEKFPQ
jgi:hypothetical protein